ncbi:YoaK family protein [Paraburkholderia strydomiana]|uniref:YoaK family protein n=1 Tax=Paraburkholderia strydomiana TaxID=1245417 RepID=UPI00286D35E7|nr:YoaK family protein [Paraburkholderia strydomiana]
MRRNLPALLSFNGGYVDTAGFVALHGLFTAHVTGNFVTLGATFVFGTAGAIAKLLALPVFCLTVMLAGAVSYRLAAAGAPVLRVMFSAQALVLAFGAVLAIRLSPLTDGDDWTAVATGLTLVAAMAIQNALHRIHLSDAPPSTLMTGTVTQFMLQLADRVGKVQPSASAGPSPLVRMAGSVASFAAGCAVAAGMFRLAGHWCFAVPPVLIAVAVVLAGKERG